MVKIKTLKTWNKDHTKRVPIAPRTHVKAVFDNNGDTLDSLMAVQDEKLTELGSKVDSLNISSGYVEDLSLLKYTKLIYANTGSVVESGSAFRGVVFRLQKDCRYKLTGVLNFSTYSEFPSLGAVPIDVFTASDVTIPSETKAVYGLFTFNPSQSPTSQCIKPTACDKIQDEAILKLTSTTEDLESKVLEFTLNNGGFYVSNVIGSTPTFTPNESYECVLLACNEGEVYNISGSGTNYARLYFTCDENKKIIRTIENEGYFSDVEVVIEKGECFIGFNTSKTTKEYGISFNGNLQDRINTIYKELIPLKELKERVYDVLSKEPSEVKISIEASETTSSRFTCLLNNLSGFCFLKASKSFGKSEQFSVYKSTDTSLSDIELVGICPFNEEFVVKVDKDKPVLYLLDLTKNTEGFEGVVYYSSSDNINYKVSELFETIVECKGYITDTRFDLGAWVNLNEVSNTMLICNGESVVETQGSYVGYAFKLIKGVEYESTNVLNFSTYSEFPSLGAVPIDVFTASDVTIPSETKAVYGLFTFKKGNNAKARTFARSAYDEKLDKEIEKLSNRLPTSYFNKNINIVCFGDSITEFEGVDGYSYPDHLKNIAGCNVYNGGIGGSHFTQVGGLTTPENFNTNRAYKVLDIPNMVKWWCENDWLLADSAVSYLAENAGDDNSSQIENLKSISVSDADIVIVMGGTNDYSHDMPLGEITDTTHETIRGSINEIIKRINETNPNIKIYFFTPLVRYISSIFDDAHWSDNYVKEEGALMGMSVPQLCEHIQDVVKRNHTPCCDLYWGLGWNKNNFLNFFNSDDGTHPRKGMKELAEKIYKYIVSH